MHRLWFLFKMAGLCLLSIGLFQVIRLLVNPRPAGAFPQYFQDAFGPSIFVKTGTLTWALAVLMVVILVCFYVNFHRTGRRLHRKAPVAGLLYGFSFGALWFVGFLEMGTIYPSEEPIRHVLSGVRDGLMLTLSGLAAGLVLRSVPSAAEPRQRGDWLIVPLVATGFAVFHGAQYYVTAAVLHQGIRNLESVLFLLGLGGVTGWMAWLHRPLRPDLPGWKRGLHFTMIYFGVNWVLYSSFYLLFLDIPLLDFAIRCAADLAGVLCGWLVFEKVVGGRWSRVASTTLGLRLSGGVGEELRTKAGREAWKKMWSGNRCQRD